MGKRMIKHQNLCIFRQIQIGAWVLLRGLWMRDSPSFLVAFDGVEPSKAGGEVRSAGRFALHTCDWAQQWWGLTNPVGLVPHNQAKNGKKPGNITIFKWRFGIQNFWTIPTVYGIWILETASKSTDFGLTRVTIQIARLWCWRYNASNRLPQLDYPIVPAFPI